MTALEGWLGRKTVPALVYDYPSIDLLAGHLAGGAEDPTSAAATHAGRRVRTESADEPTRSQNMTVS